MTEGLINRALLESNFQNPGDVYSDLKTEGAFYVVANQIDDNWNYLSGLVNSGTLTPYPAYMSRQAVINGNFDVWENGISFINPASGSFTANRFKIAVTNTGTLPTITHSRSLTSGNIQNSYYYYNINTSGAGSGFGANDSYQIFTAIEHGTRYLCGVGKQLTLSFRGFSNIANKKIGVFVSQNYGTGGEPSPTEGLALQTFTFSGNSTLTITFNTSTLQGKTFGTNNDDYIGINFFLMWGSSVGFGAAETFGGAGDVGISQVQLTAGNVQLPFMPKTLNAENDDCKRYNYRLGGVNFTRFAVGQAFSTTQATFEIPLPRMRIIPTLVTGGLFRLLDSAGAGIAATSISLAGGSTPDIANVTVSVAGGLVAGNATVLQANNDASAFLRFDAEL